jgi:hypothetical protein
MELIFIETMYQFPRMQSENERTIYEMKKIISGIFCFLHFFSEGIFLSQIKKK